MILLCWGYPFSCFMCKIVFGRNLVPCCKCWLYSLIRGGSRRWQGWLVTPFIPLKPPRTALIVKYVVKKRKFSQSGCFWLQGEYFMIYHSPLPPGNPRAFTQNCFPILGLSQQNDPTPRDFPSESCPTFRLFTLLKMLIYVFVAKNEN